MQIEIPDQPDPLIYVEIDNYAPTRVGRVMFGSTMVYQHTLEDQRRDIKSWLRADHVDEWETMTAFGEMLKLKIGD